MGTLRRSAVLLAVVVFFAVSGTGTASAAQYAALVMDARTGEVLHSRGADRRQHPASLTKMMTLYLTFEAVTNGRLKLDQKVRVSSRAARQVPSKIGLRTGQRVTIRDLIRATAVKSANDAAVALAEALGGSERDFAVLMTRRARQLGMTNTTFKNASGLTANGQLSTARDMAILGRALFYDFPQYYNLFGRKKTSALGRTIHSTNRKHLRGYEGADGIKTGYTSAAGFNLVSSAKRGRKRIIAVVLGASSSNWRNRRMAKLLDMGFERAPERAPVIRNRTLMVNASPEPQPRPTASTVPQSLLAQAGAAIIPAAQASEAPTEFTGQSPQMSPAPSPRPGSEILVAAATPSTSQEIEAAVREARRKAWAVQLGVFAKEETAIAELASAALSDVDGLDSAGRQVRAMTLSGQTAYLARLTGFDAVTAADACDALRIRGRDCLPVEAN